MASETAIAARVAAELRKEAARIGRGQRCVDSMWYPSPSSMVERVRAALGSNAGS